MSVLFWLIVVITAPIWGLVLLVAVLALVIGVIVRLIESF